MPYIINVEYYTLDTPSSTFIELSVHQHGFALLAASYKTISFICSPLFLS